MLYSSAPAPICRGIFHHNQSPFGGSQTYNDMEQTTGRTKNKHVQAIKSMKEGMTSQELTAFNEALVAEARELLAKGDGMMKAEMDDVRQRLGDIPQVINMSYIAKHYFGKSRTWLYQRINGNIVNGKPVFFTIAERRQLQEALHDIGKKLSEAILV